MRTKKLTTAALLTALCMVLLALACSLPAGAWVMLAAASLIPAAAVLRCGLGWGALCYAAAAALALLLFPGRLKGLLFVLVLGHYGILKALIERLNRIPLEWLCKLAVFNLTLALCWWLYTAVFAASVTLPVALPLLWLAANLVFVLYDLGFTAMVGWFLRRIPK